MKAHTNDFKNEIKLLGREIDSKITLNGEILTGEHINSISLHYEGAILKSVMKQLDLDIDRDIPVNTILNAQFGVKVNGAYEYLNLGNFIVYKAEKQEDTNSYKVTCYDKMLYSMKEYETTGTYPITIRDYIKAICDKLGLEFANEDDDFTNYDKVIQDELYFDEDGNSLGYTYRDVLDELAEVTASTICINNDDKLEIRYPKLVGSTTKVSGTSIYVTNAMRQGFLYDGVNNITQTNDGLPFIMELEYITKSNFETIDEEYLKNVNVNFGEKYGPINTVVLSRNEVDNISQSIPEDLADENKVAVKIVDNQIMNFDDRDTYLTEILNRLYGLEYYINDFASTGICYLDLCDIYGISIDSNVYKCLMLNDEINITQGLEENIYTNMPEEAEVEYKYTTPTDKAVREASIIIDKKISQVDIKGKTINLTADDISIASNNFNVDVNGNLTCSNADLTGFITATGGAIGGYEIDKSPSGTNYIIARAYPKYNFSQTDIDKVVNYLAGTGSLTPLEEEMYDLNNDGVVDITDLILLRRIVELEIDTGSGIHVQLTSNPNDLNMNGFSLIAGYTTIFNVSPLYGVTINNGRAYGQRELFGDISGNNGTITLVDQIDDDLGKAFDITSYQFIEVYGMDNNGQNGAYVKLTGELTNGDTFMLSVIEAGTGTYIRRTKYTIANGNQLVPSNGGYVYITSSGAVQTNSSQNYIKITRVVGYK